MKRKAVKDGLGNNVRDYIFNLAENRFEHVDELVHESTLQTTKKADPTAGAMPREPKVGTPQHKLKFPERYNNCSR